MPGDQGWGRLTRVERKALELMLAGRSPAGVAYDLDLGKPLVLELVSKALRKLLKKRDAA